MAKLFPNDLTGFNAALKGQYYEDVDNDSVYTAGTDTLVDSSGNRLDVNGVATYVKAAATVRPRTQAPVNFAAPVDFGTAAAFKKQVDLSVAGQMRDCGECHVGGGAMEYLPLAPGTNLATTPRQELRTANLTGINAWNSFIDQFDEDHDGELGEVLPQDYSQTGVLEMDCLMCHLEGYSWEARKDAIRSGKFDASRVVGAGIGEAVSGTTVNYFPDSIEPYYSSTRGWTIRMTSMIRDRIQPTVSDNCASCHADMHAVDWKKRGDSWNVPYEADVHGALGCLGCHERTDGADMLSTSSHPAPANWTGQANTALGHDPAKGNAPYSSLWNNNDNTAAKGCAGCHSGAPAANNYGAVDPAARHAALGLTSLILQTGRNGVANASHLDIIDCSGCHVRKLGHGPEGAESLYEWGTGGAMVDATGVDADGRLADHENLYVERTMENNLALAWQGNKLIRTNALTTMFWRDKDEDFVNGGAAGFVDINADGQTGGMDAVNPSHIRDAMALANLGPLTADGIVDATEVNTQRAALKAYLPTVGINLDPNGTGAQDKLKLTFMGVMFKVNHNVNPARYAWGAGGCTDCHGPDKGFYNGAYELKGRDLTINFAATDAVPLTKVNMDDYNADGAFGNLPADWQMTDFHPSLFAKAAQGNARTIALSVRNAANTSMRPIDRSEALWETDFTPANSGYDGTIITTQDGPKASRAEYVDYLNTRVTGAHNRHVAAGFGKCTTCHDDGAGNIDFASISDTGSPLAFTYTADPLGNPGTCSANACHGANGFSTSNYWVLPQVVPQLSALSSTDTDRVVELNASRSFCPNGCDYEFDFSDGNGVFMGGNGTDTAVIRYPAAGSFQAAVYATDTVTGEKRADSVTATAMIVEPEAAAMDFATAVNNNVATLTAPILDAGVVRAYIYWGDRTRTVSANPQVELANGIKHTYSRGGRSYNIVVEAIDADHIKTSFTFSQDIDLTVAIP
ncbi:MAG: hypothetical protein M0P70_11030 [Desulfobulbaceae bacterium]|nr:hypothetical protein [Desulfobulbaceae bacterium]